MNKEKLQRELITAIDTGNKDKTGKILLIYPQDDMTGLDFFLLGRAAFLIGEWELAKQLFIAAEKEVLPDWCKGANASALAILYQKIGEPEQALPYYQESMRYKTISSGLLQEYSNYLFNLYYLNKDNEFMLNEAKGYEKIIANIKPMEAVWKKNFRHKRIRVGYVTPDLDRHIVFFFSYVLFRYYDKKSFEVFIYTTASESNVTEEVKEWINRLRYVGNKNIIDIARRIRDDEIDILVDLAGHTAGNMLPVFACRPAPVQMSAIGYLGTTGMKFMDYFLADSYTMPEEVRADTEFCEQVIRLPHSHFCYMWHDNPPPVGSLPAGGNCYITFGSMNQWAKLNDDVLHAWAKIMRTVPRSRLIIKTEAMAVEYVRKIAQDRLQRAGVDIRRTDLRPSSADYLQVYREIDIALDSFPYPGGGTTCDALYMGVPVITLRGNRHNARFGVSLLSNVGLQECIANSMEDYVQKAVRLASDMEHLASLRKNLRQKMIESPVMDTRKYMNDIEDVYRTVYAQKVAIYAQKGRK